MSLLRSILLWIASLFAVPDAIDLEHARSAAAVAGARASMEREDTPPEPEPAACQKCNGQGWVRIDATTRRRCECQPSP